MIIMMMPFRVIHYLFFVVFLPCPNLFFPVASSPFFTFTMHPPVSLCSVSSCPCTLPIADAPLSRPLPTHPRLPASSPQTFGFPHFPSRMLWLSFLVLASRTIASLCLTHILLVSSLCSSTNVPYSPSCEILSCLLSYRLLPFISCVLSSSCLPPVAFPLRTAPDVRCLPYFPSSVFSYFATSLWRR